MRMPDPCPFDDQGEAPWSVFENLWPTPLSSVGSPKKNGRYTSEMNQNSSKAEDPRYLRLYEAEWDISLWVCTGMETESSSRKVRVGHVTIAAVR